MNLTIPTATATIIPVMGYKAVILQNNSGTNMYLGGSDVTTDTASTGGYVLADGKEVAISNGGGSDPLLVPLYVIHAGASDKKLTILRL